MVLHNEVSTTGSCLSSSPGTGTILDKKRKDSRVVDRTRYVCGILARSGVSSSELCVRSGSAGAARGVEGSVGVVRSGGLGASVAVIASNFRRLETEVVYSRLNVGKGIKTMDSSAELLCIPACTIHR